MKRFLLSPFRLLKERYFGEEVRNPRVARNALSKLAETLPPNVTQIAADAVERLIEFQDPDYALLYLDRLARYLGPAGLPSDQLEALARLLLTRMHFEDPINIARETISIHGGMSARPDAVASERVEVFRWDEIIAMLPTAAADPALSLFTKLHLANLSRRSVKMRFSARTRFKLLRLKAMAALRIARPFSQRFKIERSWVERWLHMIDRSHALHPDATPDIIKTAELVTGHGDIYKDGLEKWAVIVDGLIKPTCDGSLPLRTLADAVRDAHLAALRGAGQVTQAVEGWRMECAGKA